MSDQPANNGIQSTLLSRQQAKELLAEWGITELGHVLFILGSDEDRESAYTRVTRACLFCQGDLLEINLFIEDEAPEAMCRNGHPAYRAPDGKFREEPAVRGDCWRHHWNGPDRCPKCGDNLSDAQLRARGFEI